MFLELITKHVCLGKVMVTLFKCLVCLLLVVNYCFEITVAYVQYSVDGYNCICHR